ncbi:MAG: hypothetical protein HRU13_01205 [Phycisphaerales bacterium]|nr:hypothetical protein [Phycisphaerales bacterium]
MTRPVPIRRAFTLIEVGAVLAALAIGAILALPQFQEARATAWRIKDSTQLRGIAEASAVWAQYNDERFPTPSVIDQTGVTIQRPEGLEGPDHRLDTTGNVLSMLMWNGFFRVDLAVSPAEVGNVEAFDGYRSARPPSAVDPERALWDPAFRGTPLDEWGGRIPGKVGDASHNSYAQVAWFGARDRLWSNMFDSKRADFGNRGPTYTLDRDAWVPLSDTPFGDGSTTMRIHGEPTTWEGNIVFNDQHTEFVTRPDPEKHVWTFIRPGTDEPFELPDNFFHAEHDRTRALIDEGVSIVKDSDARGVIRGSLDREDNPGTGALDQRNNYLRPIAKVVPGEGNRIEAHIWVD